MILVISNNDDWSTNDVVEWLSFKNQDFVRLNFDDLDQYHAALKMEGETSTVSFSHQTNAEKSFSSDDISVIWFRRTSKLRSPKFNEGLNQNLINNLREMTELELKYYARSIFHLLGNNKKWLNHFSTSYNDKVQTLLAAQKQGIKIPATVIADNKNAIRDFIRQKGEVIIKAIYNINMFKVEGKHFMPYTTLITEEHLENLDDKLFPFLLQEKIEKKYEIRSFFLDGKFFSMAIFSQQSEQTKVDFRRYNYRRPNRRIPYQMPPELEEKLIKLMDQQNLNCGSIDIICSQDDQYYFLEVNPVGQFGMVSYPCNYYLEDQIAQFLTKATTNG